MELYMLQGWVWKGFEKMKRWLMLEGSDYIRRKMS